MLVATVVLVSLRPTISSGSPALSCPRSTRPVATVPRPVIVNTSSTGIRNGKILRSLRRGDIAIHRFHQLQNRGLADLARRVAFQRLDRRTHDDRGVVAGELVLVEKLAHFKLHQLNQLGVIDHVGFVQEDHNGGHADLTGEQDVLAGLGHGAVGSANHEDRAVHLGRAGDHVLDVVGVSRAVHVGVVAGGRSRTRRGRC